MAGPGWRTAPGGRVGGSMQGSGGEVTEDGSRTGRTVEGAGTPAPGMRTLVLGVGNRLLTDEGTGVHVVEFLAREHPGH